MIEMKYVVIVRDGKDGSQHGFIDHAYVVLANSSEEALFKVATFVHNLPKRYRFSFASRIEVTHAQDLTFAAKALGAKQVRLLKHCHSGDAVPMKEVVGYASVTVEL